MSIPIGLLVAAYETWSDEDCIRILRNCRAAMTRSARLLNLEQILEPDPAIGRPGGYLIDTQMTAMFGTARERTGVEFDQLLQGSGLGHERVIETTSPVLVTEVVPI
jgi:hypothetical protein